VEYTSPDEVAVCNLASLALNRFVTDGKFDFKKLLEVTKVVTRNLNKIIDINYYPVPEVSIMIVSVSIHFTRYFCTKSENHKDLLIIFFA